MPESATKGGGDVRYYLTAGCWMIGWKPGAVFPIRAYQGSNLRLLGSRWSPQPASTQTKALECFFLFASCV